MVPIPTKPPDVVVITVPPEPTEILSPADNKPILLSNFNFDEVPKSLFVLNNIS